MGLINEIEIKYRHKYKDYYKNINKHFVKNKGNGIDWDDKCYVPIAGTIAELSQGSNDIGKILSVISDAGLVASLCGWKANNKNVIKISDFEEKRVLNQVYIESIDIEKLYSTINYGTYLEYKIHSLDKFDIDMDGVLLSIEYDVNMHRLELRAHIVCKDKSIKPFVLHLDENKTILECLDETLNYTSNKIKEYIANNKVVDMIDLKTIEELDYTGSIYLLNYIIFSNILNFVYHVNVLEYK